MSSLRQGESRRSDLRLPHFRLDRRNRCPDDRSSILQFFNSSILQFFNRARPRARSLTVTGLNRPIWRKRINQVCPATVLAHMLQFEHEHDDENERARFLTHPTARSFRDRSDVALSSIVLVLVIVLDP
jgi:hypothetical protein